nr:putative cytochrome P450 monooxygenase [Megalurothrips usitatus]
MALTILLTAAVAVLALVYLFFSHRFQHWSKRGVPFPKPTPFFGNFGPTIRGKRPFTKLALDLAVPFREQGLGYCGIYQWCKPILMVWDPEMVKQIVCKDFSSFHDRGMPTNDSDPLSLHLFNLSGPKWRNLRNRLSPTFTSGKLKMMLPLMSDIGDNLSTTLSEEAKRSESHEVDVSSLLSRFATDIIGSVAFGIQCNCLRDENNEFLAMSRQIFQQTPAQFVRFLLDSLHPKLGRLLPFKIMFNSVHNFFITLMRDTVKYREENKVERNDFVQLMMQLRDQDLANADPLNHMELTPGVMAAQGFIFFIAGLESTSNTIAYCLSKLAQDPALQDRVAGEVRDVLRQHDGQMTYEALKKMELVNCTALEGLRLWPPVGVLIRKCNETTKVGDVLIEKDMPIFIVSDAMHTDENIFPEPQRFDPDRFSAENRSQRHPYSFLPFGEGPRICIAERFALLEMKLALAVLLRDFTFSTGPSFEADAELDPSAFFPRPKNGFKLRVEART